MTRKPTNPRPWFCIACGAELASERAQGRCRECFIGKRPATYLALCMLVFYKHIEPGRA